MAQSRRGKKGGNIKQIFRKHMRRNKGYLPLFYGNVGMDSSSMARSLRTFMQGGIGSSGRKSAYGGYVPRKGTRRRQIYDEWKKVRKRMDELIAEGYDFDTDEFRDIYTDWQSLKNSKKQLERLKKLTKTQLRREATSFLGITDKEKMWNRWKYRKYEWVDGEMVYPEEETGLTIPEVEMPGQEVRTPDELPAPPNGLPAPPDQIPYDLDIKVVNLLDDEEKYIQACEEYRATHKMSTKQLEKYYKAITLAQDCITMLMNATPEEKAAVVQFVEDHGELGPMIEQDYLRLFYVIPEDYNIPLLNVLPLTQEAADAMNDLKEDEEGFVDYSDLKPSSWDLDF